MPGRMIGAVSFFVLAVSFFVLAGGLRWWMTRLIDELDTQDKGRFLEAFLGIGRVRGLLLPMVMALGFIGILSGMGMWPLYVMLLAWVARYVVASHRQLRLLGFPRSWTGRYMRMLLVSAGTASVVLVCVAIMFEHIEL